MNSYFYDIESLENVFSLCNYKPDENSSDIYYLCDDEHIVDVSDLKQQLLNRILLRNKNYNGTIDIYNLKYESSVKHLAETFGLSDSYLVNNPKLDSSYDSYSKKFRLVCDTDSDYDEKQHPYLSGYNSYNYDTTMLTLFLYESFDITPVSNESGDTTVVTFKNVTAHSMRQYNDDLFLPKFKDCMPSYLAYQRNRPNKTWDGPNYSDPRYRIRKNMLMTGRHLDIARLNEKQSKVALKRLLGMLGYQILESDKLAQKTKIANLDEFLDLIAYNMSDCINLKKLSDHKFYRGQFSLKKGLLSTYPDIVYEKKHNEYAPDIRPESVRRDRLFIDSSSAQLATKALCPYGHLSDIPAVSFMYPSERKSKELGVPRVNVLEESRKFFYSHFPQPELRAKFDKIYYYYKSIEGKNFNESNNYRNDYLDNPAYKGSKIQPVSPLSIPKDENCMFYYNSDGTPSSCFITFSIGGIHGAEYNKKLYEADMSVYDYTTSVLRYVQSVFPNPIDLKKAKSVTLPDGTQMLASKFLKSGSTLKHAEYKTIKPPVLFKSNDDGSTSLNPAYVYTSSDLTNHEDFTSYYPNMLRMLSAFWNDGLGYDRYAEIFDNKQKYGKLMNDSSLTDDDRQNYAILREGTKLILNSASGAADANFESNIRMNNRIISMRIIGQLFTWRIGQAQTYRGAKITSTNTDGLYSVMEETINAKILAEESANIGVEIEPEPLYLISKDTNNRIEMNAVTGDIKSASGGSLACRMGPPPTKALNHPAIIDWALTEYLITAALHNELHRDDISIDLPFNSVTGMNILQAASSKFDKLQLLLMFQNVIASSIGSVNYIFATTDENPSDPIILQHYNRTFIMKDKTPYTVHLHAANAKKLTPATMSKRQRNNERPQQHDDIALSVLSANGVQLANIPDDKEAVVKKVTNVDDSWYIFICNKDLHFLSDDTINFILNNIDYDRYLGLLRNSFEKNWKNKLP